MLTEVQQASLAVPDLGLLGLLLVGLGLGFASSAARGARLGWCLAFVLLLVLAGAMARGIALGPRPSEVGSGVAKRAEPGDPEDPPPTAWRRRLAMTVAAGFGAGTVGLFWGRWLEGDRRRSRDDAGPEPPTPSS